MGSGLTSWKRLVLAAGALAAFLPASANAGVTSTVYHWNFAGAGLQSDSNGVTIQFSVSSAEYVYSTGGLSDRFGSSVSVVLIDDSTGQLIDYWYGSGAPGVFSPNMKTVTLAPASFILQSFVTGDTATVTVGAAWSATDQADHNTFLNRFCGPPHPACFGHYDIITAIRPADAVVTASGSVDGYDLSQGLTPAGADIVSGTGVYAA